MNQLYRCALYVRVSTEEQAGNPEGSIKNQEERLREFVKLKNHVAPFGDVTSVYSDPGFSAKDMNRPGFQKLLKAIERKEVNLVLVTEISRLTRSMKDFGILQDYFKKYGCEFLSLRENFDTSSATGGMVLNIMASIAEFERRQTAERISASFLARAKRGLHNGGAVPLGYRIDPNRNGGLLIVPEEAEIVKRVFSTFLKFETLAATAKALNDEGVILPPRTWGGGGKERGRNFKIDTARAILRNPIYAGIRSYRIKKGAGFEWEYAPGVWDPIIERDVFERIQRQLTKNRHRKRSHLNLRYPFTLSGVTYCKACGHRMTGKSAYGRNGKIPYYEHSWALKQQAASTERKPMTCVPARILAQKIEPEVWRDVKGFLLNSQYASRILRYARENQPKETPLEKKRLGLEAKEKSLKRQIEILAERLARLPETLDPTSIYGQMESLQKEHRETQACLTQAQSTEPAAIEQDRVIDVGSMRAFTASLRAALERADSNPDLQAAIIRKLVHRVEIRADAYEISFHAGEQHYRGFPRDPYQELVFADAGADLDEGQNEKGGLAIAGEDPGLHNKMEMLSRRAFGFRNFQNYRLRVIALCGWNGVFGLRN